LFVSVDAREHGDAALRSLGSGAVDFSVNLNPYAPAPELWRAVRDADISAYPDSSARGARVAWASRLGCDPDELVFAHGAAELIWHVVRSLVRSGERCALLAPTFAEPAAAARAAGAELVQLPCDAHFRHDLFAHASTIGGCRLAYLCTPNNPTGAHVPAVDIDALAAACPNTWLLVDQSFLALSDHAAELVRPIAPNVIALRSLTKEHALAGLRVGYLRCAPSLARRLETTRPSWPTSAPAQAAAVAAAACEQFVHESWLRLRDDRERLRGGLEVLGLAPIASATTFQLVAVPNASELTRRLAQRHRIAVRDCRSFGLANHLRLSARPAADRERLMRALAEELS